MRIDQKLLLIQKLSELTQEKLAQKLGVSFVTLNSWINKRSLPHKSKQEKIDQLYAEYTGTKSIPETVLEGKKEIVEDKQRKYKNILNNILNNPDIYNQFILSLTFNTNRIEGSTLNKDETAAVLFQNASLPKKSLVEQLEAKNHQTALEYLFQYFKSKEIINQELILKLHSILMNSIRDDAGAYRSHSVRIVGANIPTANYLKISGLMRVLIKEANSSKRDIVKNVAGVHSKFEQIHPFSDGNGRIGRLLIIAMLLRKNIAPAIIKQEKRQSYISSLNKSQRTDDFSLLEDFICDAVLEGYKIIERKLKPSITGLNCLT